MPSRFSLCFSALVLAASLSAPTLADEVSDALKTAADAYAAGDLGKASEQMTMARQALGAQQSAMLAALLPVAPSGWTMTPTDGFAQGFGMAGGGSGAEARYDNADGSMSVTLSFIADNPMVGSMGAMLGNVQMMAAVGKVAKVGDQPLLQTDGNISTLVNSRVLFQAQGADAAALLPLVQAIDFARVGVFAKK